MACYKSALIDLDRREANKGQAMNWQCIECGADDLVDGGVFRKINEKGDFAAFCKICKHVQPDRLRRVDTENGEAIVGSANIDEIAEVGRNDQPKC